MIAADIMTENVRFIRPEETIADAVELLQSLEVRHLPVVNEDDELVGMLSDRDLRALFVPFDEDGETAGSVLMQGRMPVSKIMSSNVVAVDADDSVTEVVDRLLEDKVGALPVVDHDNKLVGIISYVDVLRNWQEERPDGAPVRAAAAGNVMVARKAKASSGKKSAATKKAPAKGAATKGAATKGAATKKAPAKAAATKGAATKGAATKKAPAKAGAVAKKATATKGAVKPAKGTAKKAAGKVTKSARKG